jgi:hypothetical protein
MRALASETPLLEQQGFEVVSAGAALAHASLNRPHLPGRGQAGGSSRGCHWRGGRVVSGVVVLRTFAAKHFPLGSVNSCKKGFCGPGFSGGHHFITLIFLKVTGF